MFRCVWYFVGVNRLSGAGSRRRYCDRCWIWRRIDCAISVGHRDVSARPELFLRPTANRTGAIAALAPIVACNVLPLQHALAACQTVGQ